MLIDDDEGTGSGVRAPSELDDGNDDHAGNIIQHAREVPSYLMAAASSVNETSRTIEANRPAEAIPSMRAVLAILDDDAMAASFTRLRERENRLLE